MSDYSQYEIPRRQKSNYDDQFEMHFINSQSHQSFRMRNDVEE